MSQNKIAVIKHSPYSQDFALCDSFIFLEIQEGMSIMIQAKWWDPLLSFK
jgi:hypothetical protein